MTEARDVQPEMPVGSSWRDLQVAVTALLDWVPTSRVEAIVDHKLSTLTTCFRTQDVYRLFDILEQTRPGLLATYLEIRHETDDEVR